MAAASVLASSNHQLAEDGDGDFIDMEVMSSSSSSSSSKNYKNLCYASISSPPPQGREFEFQMCSSVSSEDQKGQSLTTYFPADELFYKGKLLPLHLPPRLLMVQNLLQNDSLLAESSAATQMDQSCRVISEMNPDENDFSECSSSSSNEMLSGFISHAKKNYSWARKLRQIKKSSILGQKLRASRVYVKSLFCKSTCSSSDEAKPAAAPCSVVETEQKYMKAPFGKNENGNCYNNNSKNKKGILKMVIDHQDVSAISHRKSFSGATQRHSPSTSTSSSGASSLSSSFSFTSVGFYNLRLLKRSSSANSEIECSVDGAIAHCKQSHSQSRQQQQLLG